MRQYRRISHYQELCHVRGTAMGPEVQIPCMVWHVQVTFADVLFGPKHTVHMREVCSSSRPHQHQFAAEELCEFGGSPSLCLFAAPLLAVFFFVILRRHDYCPSNSQ